MARNDEMEKFKQAEYWIRCAPATSEQYQAALSHLIWVEQGNAGDYLASKAGMILTHLGNGRPTS